MTKNIHTAILEVVRKLEPIQKNGTLELGGRPIAFTRIDDIRDALNPLLAAEGIVSYVETKVRKHRLQVASEPMTMANVVRVPDPANDGKFLTHVDASGREVRDGKIPTTRCWAIVRVKMTFVLAATGESYTARAEGEAYDTNGDKAVAKATTAGVKRILSEVFKVTDKTEGDEEERDPEARNRPTTTDARSPEGQDRGGQARAAAHGATTTGSTRRSGPPAQRKAAETPAQPSDEAVEAADPATGEVPDERPEPNAPPEPDPIQKQKDRIRKAVAALKARDGKDTWTQAEVDAIATDATGKATRPEWVNKISFVTKVADALEGRLG